MLITQIGEISIGDLVRCAAEAVRKRGIFGAYVSLLVTPSIREVKTA